MRTKSTKATEEDRKTGQFRAGDTILKIDASKEDMYRRGLPKEVQSYVVNEFMINAAWVELYGIYRKLGSKDAMLRWLKEAQCLMVIRDYGPDHPSARKCA